LSNKLTISLYARVVVPRLVGFRSFFIIPTTFFRRRHRLFAFLLKRESKNAAAAASDRKLKSSQRAPKSNTSHSE
jgi:hypothetical protein